MGALVAKIVFKSGKEQLPKKQLSFFDFKKRNIDGDIVDFRQYQGHVKCFIVVNVACK